MDEYVQKLIADELGTNRAIGSIIVLPVLFYYIKTTVLHLNLY